jgi:CheY-like chemotaxis protein
MRRTSFTILVAQDDPDEQLIFKAALQETGYQGKCRFAKSRRELFGYLSRVSERDEGFELPGLIILDLDIPVSDLRYIVKVLKSRPCLTSIPIVFLAPTFLDSNGTQADVDLDVDAVVMKPMAFKEFVVALRSGLKPFCKQMFKAPGTDDSAMT